jgi:hypothetical protein
MSRSLHLVGTWNGTEFAVLFLMGSGDTAMGSFDFSHRRPHLKFEYIRNLSREIINQPG